MLAALSSGKPAAEADLEDLEAKISEKIEVSAKSVLSASTAFTAALASIATGIARGRPDPTRARPAPSVTVCRRSVRR